LLAAAPAFAERLPDFNLNALRAKDLLEHNFSPELSDGIREYNSIPGAPEPVCARADGRPMTTPPFQPVAEFYPLYGGLQSYGLPPSLSRAGYIQMTSSTKFRMNREKGELTVEFPEVKFGGGAYGDRADLFVKVTGGADAPALSWATVLCSQGAYLGYKGSTVAFPQKSGSFSINETLALGAPKALISRTHHWLTEGMVALEDLCADDFREKMKDARAETLPASLGAYNFDFNARKNSLKVKWENK